MYTPKVEAAGRDVLLVNGILQSGVTLDHLYRYILGQNPSSVRTASLIEKTDERKVDVSTDYVGFKSKEAISGRLWPGLSGEVQKFAFHGPAREGWLKHLIVWRGMRPR